MLSGFFALMARSASAWAIAYLNSGAYSTPDYQEIMAARLQGAQSLPHHYRNEGLHVKNHAALQ